MARVEVAVGDKIGGDEVKQEHINGFVEGPTPEGARVIADSEGNIIGISLLLPKEKVELVTKA